MEGTGKPTLIAAIRGPIMLMALGGLFLWDYLGRVSVWRSFPALLIVYGALKLLEHLFVNSAARRQGGAP